MNTQPFRLPRPAGWSWGLPALVLLVAVAVIVAAVVATTTGGGSEQQSAGSDRVAQAETTSANAGPHIAYLVSSDAQAGLLRERAAGLQGQAGGVMASGYTFVVINSGDDELALRHALALAADPQTAGDHVVRVVDMR